MSFLSAFKTFGHAIEAAAKIAAPIIATVDPTIGSLMAGATSAAMSLEASITADGAGPQKAAAVAASTQATVDTINAILAAEGKKPLPVNTTDAVVQQVQAVITSMNTIQKVVEAAPATPTT